MALLESLHMGRTMLLNTTGEWVYAGPDCGGKTLNCWFSHLRPFPLAPIPAYALAHVGPFPLRNGLRQTARLLFRPSPKAIRHPPA